MFLRARNVLFVLLLVALPAVSAFAAAQGRLQALVVDEQGKPLPGVEVEIVNSEIGFEKRLTTNKKGSFTLMVLDATQVYEFRFSKEGYPTVTDMLKLQPGDAIDHTFTVASAAAVGSAGAATAPVAGRGRAVNLFNDGVGLLQKGDRAAALVKFQEAADADPDMPQPWSVMAGIHLEEKRYDESIAAAEKLLAIAPDDPVGLQTLYDAYQGSGQAEKAQATLERLAASAKGTDAAVRIFNAGADAAKAGNLDTALTLFEKAVEADPTLAPGHAAAAQIYLVNEEYQKAVEAAERALALDAGLLDSQRVRYEGYRLLGQADKAKEVFDEMAAAAPGTLAETLYMQGRQAFYAGQTAEAVVALEQAVTAKPDHARAHYMLGLALANTGDTAKARQHLEKFIELAPDDSEAATAREMIKYMG
jgi:tetratricopeptide (TPR) repeat protein